MSTLLSTEVVSGGKFSKLNRFELPTSFKIGAGSSHPRSEALIKKTATIERVPVFRPKRYVLFISRSFVQEEDSQRSSGGTSFSSESYFVRGDKDSNGSRSVVSQILSPEHPAFLASVEEDGFRDVNRAVYFSQLTRALLSGSSVLVADLRKFSHAAYRSSCIEGLETDCDLSNFSSAPWINTEAIRQCLNIGVIHVLLASKMFRNEDLANSNIGRVGDGGHYALFDFDRVGMISLEASVKTSFMLQQAQAWGFSLEGVDKAAWIPPFSIEMFRNSGNIYGKGPVRWMDRHVPKPDFVSNAIKSERESFYEGHKHYYRKQNFWRSVWHNLGCIETQYHLYLKFLMMSDAWLKNIQVGFLGEAPQSRVLLQKSYLMRADIGASLLKSALFRLSFFVKQEAYAAQIQREFQTYNERAWPDKEPRKAKNNPYRLRFEEERFESWKHLFLVSLPPLSADQETRCAYLQFLILLSHLRVPSSASAEKAKYQLSTTAWNAELKALDETHCDKLHFFKFLFERLTTSAPYEELFFLCKVFQILYPSLEKVRPDQWLAFGGIPVKACEKRFYFPEKEAWAFNHFSWAELHSDKAKKNFSPNFSAAHEMGTTSPAEAHLEMAQIILNFGP